MFAFFIGNLSWNLCWKQKFVWGGGEKLCPLARTFPDEKNAPFVPQLILDYCSYGIPIRQPNA